MLGKWSFIRARKSALKELIGRHNLASQTAQFEELVTAADAVPQTFARAASFTVAGTRIREACLLSSDLNDEFQFLRRIHISWRYDAYRWISYIRRAEQLANDFPVKAKRGRLPIGDIGSQNASSILLTMATAAILGEDEAHDWFGNRCFQMLENNEPFVAVDEWSLGPVAPFLMWLFSKWRGIQNRYDAFGFGSLGVFQRVVDNWESSDELEVSVASICDLHMRKIREILKPDDDFIFGLGIGLGYFIPIVALYIQRIRNDLGLTIPKPSHPFLDSPMAQIPFPCPRSGYDPFIDRAMSLCREFMPDLSIPWEEIYQSDESDLNRIEELNLTDFKL